MDVIMAMDELLFPCFPTMANRYRDSQPCVRVTLPAGLRSRLIQRFRKPRKTRVADSREEWRIVADKIGVNPLPPR